MLIQISTSRSGLTHRRRSRSVPKCHHHNFRPTHAIRPRLLSSSFPSAEKLFTIRLLSSGLFNHMLDNDPISDVLPIFGVACARAVRGSVPASLAFGRVRGKGLRRRCHRDPLKKSRPLLSSFPSINLCSSLLQICQILTFSRDQTVSPTHPFLTHLQTSCPRPHAHSQTRSQSQHDLAQ